MKSVRMEQFRNLPAGQKFIFVRYDRVKPRGPRRLISWREVCIKNFNGGANTADGQDLPMPIADDDLVIRLQPYDEGREG